MRKLHLVGATSDLEALLFTARKGSKSGGYVVSLDDELLGAIADTQRRRSGEPAEAEARVLPPPPAPATRPPAGQRAVSSLTPREMQARLRAGRSIEEVAAEAGVEREWVERFAVPILAEQAQVVELARSLVYAKPRLGGSSQPLAESVVWNLSDRGVWLSEDVLDRSWNAYQLHDAVWMIRFRFRARGREQEALWELDVPEARLVARNRMASELGFVEKGRRRGEPRPEPDGPVEAGAAAAPAPVLAPAPRGPAPARRPEPTARRTDVPRGRPPRSSGPNRPPAKAGQGRPAASARSGTATAKKGRAVAPPTDEVPRGRPARSAPGTKASTARRAPAAKAAGAAKPSVVVKAVPPRTSRPAAARSSAKGSASKGPSSATAPRRSAPRRTARVPAPATARAEPGRTRPAPEEPPRRIGTTYTPPGGAARTSVAEAGTARERRPVPTAGVRAATRRLTAARLTASRATPGRPGTAGGPSRPQSGRPGLRAVPHTSFASSSTALLQELPLSDEPSTGRGARFEEVVAAGGEDSDAPARVATPLGPAGSSASPAEALDWELDIDLDVSAAASDEASPPGPIPLAPPPFVPRPLPSARWGADPSPAPSRSRDARPTEDRPSDVRSSEARSSEPRPSEPRPSDTRPGEPRPSSSRSRPARSISEQIVALAPVVRVDSSIPSPEPAEHDGGSRRRRGLRRS